MSILSLTDYQIYLGEYWNKLTELIATKSYTSVLVIVDENTKLHCLPVLKKALPDTNFKLIEIHSGEVNKHLETCRSIWFQMMKSGADRHSLTINLGGGVIGDIGGFCAATFKRGMDFIQIPTTLLSQVDASIGGKLGFDFNMVKNGIGIFKNPNAVFINPIFLKTLPPLELRSGFAEIIKHCLIADKEQWSQLPNSQSLEQTDWSELLASNIDIKKQIVLQDPFEENVRKKLNFGHTIGHAIESYFLDTTEPLLHGEAIAIGMICESYLSSKAGHLSNADFEVIVQYILQIFEKRTIPPIAFNKLIFLMESDKKNHGNEINFTMLKAIGDALINQVCSTDLILESLAYYNAL